MIRLPNVALPATVGSTLAKYQAEVDAVVGFPAKVAKADAAFKSRNKPKNAAFAAVRASLAQMCSGARRCAYCEDSAADEVEHMAPKSIHPELVFQWSNYVYACGACNGPKNSRWELIDTTGQLVIVAWDRKSPRQPPPTGRAALIDPRQEDPLDFLELDLVGTFLFVPRRGLAADAKLRAERTVDMLGLNRRDVLPDARQQAFDDYLQHLEMYVQRKADGAPQAELDRRAHNIRRRQHPTVWNEMRRQRAGHAALASLFAAAPEALAW